MNAGVGPSRRLNAKEVMFWTVVLEKTLESHLNSKEIKPVSPQGNQSWIFMGRTDAEAEAPILWPHDVKNRLFGKDPGVGKDWGQEERGVTEDKMVGWHLRLNGHVFEQTLGDSEGQWKLACCSSYGVRSLTWLSDDKNNSIKTRNRQLIRDDNK